MRPYDRYMEARRILQLRRQQLAYSQTGRCRKSLGQLSPRGSTTDQLNSWRVGKDQPRKPESKVVPLSPGITPPLPAVNRTASTGEYADATKFQTSRPAPTRSLRILTRRPTIKLCLGRAIYAVYRRLSTTRDPHVGRCRDAARTEAARTHQKESRRRRPRLQRIVALPIRRLNTRPSTEERMTVALAVTRLRRA